MLPGYADGEIKFQGLMPALAAGNQSSELIRTQAIRDSFGNIVKDGTRVTIVTSNMDIDGEPNELYTVNGEIEFRIKPKTTSGSASVILVSENAYGQIPFYVKTDYPHGEIRLQPYLQSMIANEENEIALRTELIKDKFGNIVDDGFDISLSTEGGTLSTNRINYSTSLVVKTFGGQSRFYLKSGKKTGRYVINAISVKSAGYSASGSFSINYTPGQASGLIPILPHREAINADNEFIPVTVGPLSDSFGNIVTQGTPVNLLINNGRTFDGSYRFITDSNGLFQFTLSGAGNRGPIDITVSSGNSSGHRSIWAYKDSHLTMRGQKRDDIGIKAGDNGLNSGRSYVIYAGDGVNSIPSPGSMGNEIFDYNSISSQDSSFLEIKGINGSPVSTAGDLQSSNFSIKVPNTEDSSVESILSYSGFKFTPDFKSDVFYSSGNKIVSAPFWIKQAITAGSISYGCSSNEPDRFDNYLTSAMVLNKSNGELSCRDNSNPIMSTLAGDKIDNNSSGLYFPVIGNIESPIGCAFRDGQFPTYSLNMGEFTKEKGVEKLVTVSNPGNSILKNIIITMPSSAPTNWSVENYDCPHEDEWVYIEPKSQCNYKIRFNVDQTTGPGEYATKLQVSSSLSPVEADIRIQITENTSASGEYGGTIGAMDIKSNCLSKLVTFGGHEYRTVGTGISERTAKLLSLYNSRGQSIGRYDKGCFNLDTQEECILGNGCKWVANSCVDSINLGAFPASGFSHSQMASVDKRGYIFSGFDPSGAGQPAEGVLRVYNSETDSWSVIEPEQNEENIPNGEKDNLDYKAPKGRYLHSIAYVPENRSLYIYGGIGSKKTINPEGEMVVTYDEKLNDLWKLTLFEEGGIGTSLVLVPKLDLKWELVCMNCAPLPGGSLFERIINLLLPGPGSGGDMPTQSYLVWNRASQRMFLFFKGKQGVYEFNPLASNVKNTMASASSEANGLSGASQIIYNPVDSRIYGYFRGQTVNYFKLWDMESGKKSYVLSRFYLGQKSKLHGTVVTPRIRAYGSSGINTSGVNCGPICKGVVSYIYNHDENRWVTIGDNSLSTKSQLSSSGEISSSYSGSDARKMISSDGYVDIITTTRGSPDQFNQLSIDYIWLDGTF